MVSQSSKIAFPAPDHDHERCVCGTMARAKAAFEARGVRLTELRLAVFSEIAASHHAVGAYDIIDQLSRKGTRLAPVSVYRAIDALLTAGVVHRLESRNAFFACHASHASERQNVVLACGTCGIVVEVEGDAVFTAIDAIVTTHRFEMAARVVEVAGRCAHCAEAVL
jgi:Fur family transcriptional regulator, zinc uptake regulator